MVKYCNYTPCRFTIYSKENAIVYYINLALHTNIIQYIIMWKIILPLHCKQNIWPKCCIESSAHPMNTLLLLNNVNTINRTIAAHHCFSALSSASPLITSTVKELITPSTQLHNTWTFYEKNIIERLKQYAHNKHQCNQFKQKSHQTISHCTEYKGVWVLPSEELPWSASDRSNSWSRVTPSFLDVSCHMGLNFIYPHISLS